MGQQTQAVADALRSLEAINIRAVLAYPLLMLQTAVQLEQKGGAK